MARPVKEEILRFVLDNVAQHPDTIVQMVAKEFAVTRQTATNYLVRMIRSGEIVGKGTTKGRTYHLKSIVDIVQEAPVTSDMADDEIWREQLLPAVKPYLARNVLDICQYGFTEMMNNVIDHSESPKVLYWCELNASYVILGIKDYGVGIFEKIRKAFDLDDRRHALLELSKGKLTTDARRHSGEGIFFTSRMMDRFSITSIDLFYTKERSDDGWLIDIVEGPVDNGTTVIMRMARNSPHTSKEVFDKFSTGEDYGFAKTHVPLQLARYEGESLVSRSQARRLMARVERFQEVILDFSGIDTIGQAFADEIFRVFASQHPEIRIITLRTNPDVDKMIARAKGGASLDPKLPGF
ncbi:ArsR family transcriptional regulator [Hyphomicrobium nitrativorans NL23]|uniref:ArsR family transcriptional regulator n=1 Tax=Hyphomicrobium nitrativorans NL23 TaxID=1029756 RepID=V5SDX9_9HYPH|nr:DUF4325 domain-containing protein [Hyphomicrobium nitrativorans]AHB48164.1 ArsR family transcriptional regulator [Hyphomicrobium nitrativorans NL23]